MSRMSVCHACPPVMCAWLSAHSGQGGHVAEGKKLLGALSVDDDHSLSMVAMWGRSIAPQVRGGMER
jgi:hypothetical protein